MIPYLIALPDSIRCYRLYSLETRFREKTSLSQSARINTAAFRTITRSTYCLATLHIAAPWRMLREVVALSLPCWLSHHSQWPAYLGCCCHLVQESIDTTLTDHLSSRTSTACFKAQVTLRKNVLLVRLTTYLRSIANLTTRSQALVSPYISISYQI